MSKLRIALACVVLLVCAGAASADGITNTFVGTVSGIDSGNYFGGADLTGDSFTLTMTLDPTVVAGQSFVVGGTYYGSPNPITAALTINDITQTINDSSDAFFFDLGLGDGTIEAYLQAFNFVNQVQFPGVFVDLNTLVPASMDLGTPLPSMLLSNNDFTNNSASFYDANGENLSLDVQAVNVPEPGTLTLLAAGMITLALMLRRHAG
jgi:hypothetical protein